MVRSVRASESLSLIIISEVVLAQDEALLLRNRMEKISGADVDIAILLHRRQHMCCSAKFFPHRCARKPCELLFLGVVHLGRYSRSMVDGGTDGKYRARWSSRRRRNVKYGGILESSGKEKS